jgi:hypothetical protein
MMQKANVNHGKTKMDNKVRRGELPCIRRFRSVYTVDVRGGAKAKPMETKKRWGTKDEANKRIYGKVYLLSQNRSWNIC